MLSRMTMNVPQRLGAKTFWLFFLSNAAWAFALLVGVIILFVGKGYAGDALPATAIPVIDDITIGGIALFALALFIAFFAAWLTYINLTYELTDNAFTVRRGIFDKEETSIPYRQIQSIDLRQDIIGQIFGFSTIVVLTAGHDQKDEEGEAEAEFPAMDRALAANLREELLKRSETERVVMQK